MASETAEEAESEFATIRRDGGDIPSKEPVSFVDWIADFYEIDEPKHLNKHLRDSVLSNEKVNTVSKIYIFGCRIRGLFGRIVKFCELIWHFILFNCLCQKSGSTRPRLRKTAQGSGIKL